MRDEYWNLSQVYLHLTYLILAIKMSLPCRHICMYSAGGSSNKKTGLVICWNMDREGKLEKWPGVRRSRITSLITIQNRHIISSHFHTVWYTVRYCAALCFHVIVSSDCGNFTFLDKINDVQGEDEKHQSTVEVTGNLIGELPSLTVGNVILTMASLLNLLLRATYQRPGLASWAIWQTKVSQRITDSVT